MTAPPIKLRSPADLLAVIPHLLGFVPNNAVVVVALKDKRIDLTQRMDLPDSDRAAEVAQALALHVLREEAEAALLVAYEDTPSESLALLDSLGAPRRVPGGGPRPHRRLRGTVAIARVQRPVLLPTGRQSGAVGDGGGFRSG